MDFPKTNYLDQYESIFNAALAQLVEYRSYDDKPTALAQMVEHRPFMSERGQAADSRGFNPRMRYFHTINTKYIMPEFKSFWIAYHEVDEKDETKWVVYDGYTTFKDAWHNVMTYYQFKGMLPNYAWFIYGVQEDKTKVKLNHDGTPV